ncbi:hypothetical protein PF005_g12457 [Phytophthora fragariae]|uniref:sn-1-specific diacylglycerol lipase n=1 Tax=Phytophthora fragariae TaxID=53985 RepID=A0A6A4D7I0_9STRA|nr:hypothetical protein PF003_g28017 [Phytophthora fragariae]KAE8936295.1 hypothetical protein PF009_g13775 [Phytophthora fragariae]KAE8992683.1 hypothetical protein PF011_g17456 [Phytophthora fragariae]KAE9108086.1 hypothetical protein PF007_g12791 [Phytophthora fragariae]KAE9125038.1 hypothetical protein PF006_g17047 [Phytophthora fragariae]
MPALEVFGRRSRVVGSDDLYCPALFLMLYHIPLALLCVLYAGLWRRCSSTALDDSGLPFWYMLGAAPLLFFRGCIYLMIMHVSAKGTIVDHERRVLMPRMLQVHALWSVLLFAYGVAGVCCWYYRDMCHPDARFVLAVGGFLVAEVSFTFSLGVCILGDAPPEDSIDQEKPPVASTLDPYGNAIDSERQSLLDEVDREVPSSDVYVPHSQRLWKQRCTRCCMCLRCFTCNLFGGAGTRHDSMSVVAKVFSRLFYGSPDLVISDIVAGFVLLAAVQAYEDHHEVIATSPHREGDEEEEETLGKLRARIRASTSKMNLLGDRPAASGDTVATASASSASQVSTVDGDESNRFVSIEIPSSTDSQEGQQVKNEDAKFGKSTKPFYYHPSDPHLNDVELTSRLKELAHFSKYAIGIYGWMLYVWSHPWTGTFRLAFSCLRRKLRWVHGDNWFHLGQTALQLETKVKSDDIVYASFRNSVYQPAFAVMLDHERKEVVLAIRGTLSLEDCLTDAIAYGMSMDDVADRWGCDGAGEYAHQGFLTCAESVYLELNRLGVLEMLFDEKSTAAIATSGVNVCERGAYHDYGLVLTGHSLGAGTAVLLSVMLRPKYPQLRCFAFSPPGCTMSPGLASRCAAFTDSVVVGDDIIARSSLTSAEELRDHVLDLIGRSKVNKAAILRQVIAWRTPDELLHRSCDEHSAFDDDGYGGERVRSPFIAHLSNYRTMLQRIQESEPIHELTIPGRVVHLKRVVRAKGAGGCWVCCRPGGGGICCTARTNYRFAWAAEGQFSKIRIGRTMLDDHFPDKVNFVLQDCVKRMRKSEHEHECL